MTKLADRREGQDGLDLTRATLNALIKYPWPRGNRGKQARKWNCYSTEEPEFAFARDLDPGATRQGAEAALMDWADDIAYSVHDMEDFYRAGKIPLERLVRDEEEVGRFLGGVFAVWREHGQNEGEHFNAYAEAFSEVLQFFNVDRPYVGDAQQRHELKALTSLLIGRYINGIKLRQPGSPQESFVVQDRNMANEIAMLKELTWHYVIRDPALATQQHGQRRIISGLFDTYFDACCEKRKWHIFPPRYREIAERDGADGKDNTDLRVRLVCDLIAGMSEQQAVAMSHRLNGIVPGPAFASLLS